MVRRYTMLAGLMAMLAMMGLMAMMEVSAQEAPAGAEDLAIQNWSEVAIKSAGDFLASILFYPVPVFGAEIPLTVFWLIAGGVFFTLKLGFVNIRMFCHAIQVVRGKYSNPEDPGEVSHLAALSAAVSATVGLGNIAGVAVAVSIGGPGAVIWMVVGGAFGMATKFAEVTMGQKYREFDEKGKVSGGAFHYLEKGLAEKGKAGLGKVLAVLFAICCIGTSFGAGDMFQANQAVTILTTTFDPLEGMDYAIALVFSVAVGVVLIGGIRRIANVAEGIVPLMAFIYLASSVVILIVHADQLGAVIATMFGQAFGFEAATGGVMGAIIAGVQRSTFSNEAGIGSAPIAHAAARTNEPVREGCVALLEPFIDTVVICFMTGLVITVTGVWKDPSIDGGVVLTSAAFATVSDWFPYVLSLAIVLFAYSTMITWSYYGERCWLYLFGKKKVGLYYILFCFCTFIGGINSLDIVINLSDMLLFMMAFPNLIGLYILSGDIRRALKDYRAKLQSGQFPVYK